MRFRFQFHALSPESVPIDLCIEAESRIESMKLVWDKNQGFVPDQNKPIIISVCGNGCRCFKSKI